MVYILFGIFLMVFAIANVLYAMWGKALNPEHAGPTNLLMFLSIICAIAGVHCAFAGLSMETSKHVKVSR